GLTISTPLLHPCCRNLSFPEYHTTAYYPFDTWFRYVGLAVNTACSIIIIICYSVMFYVIRSSSNNANLRDRSHHPEWRFSLQVFLMSGVFLATFSSYFFLPYLGGSRWVAILAPTLFIVQNFTHPAIAFVFNTAIRREALRVL
ncbi:hypothetical protein PMAYCL1PPCAC_13429, partial [Pristionchus mayeri]